ncbi:MAG: lipopolysaccharide biosynthesis protein [Candidatus Thorarchaeota archaeon]|jgi:O-antigen/teichoic acid export membrane protein
MSDVASTAARGTSAFIGQAAVTGLLRVLNLAILTRLLIQEEMGQIAFLGIIYGFMQFLGALGLNHASPLVVPEEEVKGSIGRVRGFLKRALAIILVSSSAMAALVLLLSPFLFAPSLVSPDLIRLVLIIAPFSALETFLDSFLLARYSVKHLASGRIVFDIARITGTVGLVLLGMGVEGVMIGWLIGEVVAVAVFSSAAMRGLNVKSVAIEMTPVLAFALPNLAFQTIDVTIQNTDRLMLLYITDLAALGVFDVILRILYMLSLVSLTIASSIYPILTRIRVSLDSEGEDWGREMGNVITNLVRYILILLLPVAIIAALNSSIVLEVLFGVSYATYPNASLSFAILVLSYALWGVIHAIHTTLRSMGEAKFFIAAGLGVIAFEIIGAWYLIMWLGLLGSAIIRSLYVFLLFIASWGRLRQKGVRGLGTIGISVLKVGFASVIAGCFVYLVQPAGVFDLVFWILCGAALYFLLLFGFREARALDFQIARSVLPMRLHGVVKKIERTYLGDSQQ